MENIETKTKEERDRKVLGEANELYQAKQYPDALNMVANVDLVKITPKLIPYFLEMRIRNLMALLQFKSAHQVLKEALQLMPDLRDFIIKKIECEVAMSEGDSAKSGIKNMRKKLEDNKKGDLSTKKILDQSKLSVLLTQMESLLQVKKERDLTKIRVAFKGDGFTKKKTRLSGYLTKMGVMFSQTLETANVVFKVNVKDQKEVQIDFKPLNFTVNFTNDINQPYYLSVDLFSEIDPKTSIFDFNNEGLLVLVLIKKEAKNWDSLQVHQAGQTSGFDNQKFKEFCDDYEDDEERLRLQDGNGGMKLFKDIFHNGNSETQRAMNYSYQMSGGTVLTTNWDEAKEKDYEGKDRPTAPDGQEWRDWRDA